jgi:hypothetical protein
MQISILQPALALVIWTLVVWVWMYATRLPAILKAKVNFDKVKNGAQLRQTLPERANWATDNYNHLHEQPTVFFALCFMFAIINGATSLDVKLAWAYVVLRIAHSLWQILINSVNPRFVLFILSTLMLIVLTFRAALLI